MLKPMKKLIVSILSVCIALSSCTTHNVDLENVTFKEDVNVLIKDHKKSIDQLEMLTGLPGYLIADVKGYHFGTVDVPNGGSVEFLFNSNTDKKLAGMDINFKTDTSSKLLSTYIFKKYGKPSQVLQKEQKVYDSNDNAYRSSAAYLWNNIKPGISMVLLNKNEEINKQPWHTSEVIILKNDITPASPLNSSTSLNRVIQNYSPLD
jgi:hypothetical protein